jgi:deazaflavin-dependent oxidoreductase (nitroreductase family)
MSGTASAQARQISTGAPPKWMNAIVAGMLRTPGLQRLLGGSLALITFTGRKSGKRYMTPVSYYRDGDTVIILTKTVRFWWSNLLANPRVTLRLAGREVSGIASVSVGNEESLPALMTFLENRPMDARAFGLHRSQNGRLDWNDARAILPQIVVIRVTLT